MFANETSLFLLLRKYEIEIFPNTRFSKYKDFPKISLRGYEEIQD